MGLISHGLAVGIGYYAAQPGGRRRLTQLRQRVLGLAQSPQMARLQERGRGLVGDRALDARTPTTGKHARTDLTAGDVVTADPTTTDTAGRDSVVDPSVPLRGRRLRRQRDRENRRLRPPSAAAAHSPTPDTPGDRAR